MILLERSLGAPDQLPQAGLARLEQIIGDPKAEPPIPALVPVSKSTWWLGVRTGRFPPAIKVTPGVSAWRWRDINRLLDNLRPTKEWSPGSESPATGAARSNK
jgi:prophage regulatory protein